MNTLRYLRLSMDYQKAIEYIIARLRQELPDRLKYHSPEHTISVIRAAEKLGERHGISLHEMQLLLTAAAYHDSGFLKTYRNHEEESCRIAEKVLPDFGFKKEDIEVIKGMIMATKVPQKPHTLLEKIICDADLVYLGGDNYDSISTTLHKELTLNGIELDEDQWLDMQINFLESHNYWTEYYLNRLAPNKKNVLDRLKSKKAS
jgi:uncharacterized protein